MRRLSPARQQAGFTLIELMIVVIVVSILLAIAAPSFYTVIQENKIRTQASRIVSSLNLARSTAAKENITATLCASSDAATCTGDTSHFKEGWLVYADRDGSGTLTSSSDELVRTYKGLPDSYILELKIDSTEITYYPDGSSSNDGSASGEEIFKICPPTRDEKQAWSVIVNVLGSPRMKRPDDCS